MYMSETVLDMRQRKIEDPEAVARYQQQHQPLLSADSPTSLRKIKQQHAAYLAAVSADIKSRLRPHVAWAIYIIFTVASLQEQKHIIPPRILQLLVLAGIGALVHKIWTFRRWADEHRYVPRFLWCFSALVIELLWENVMVWVVSATDLRKYDNPPGLQDNVDIVFSAAAERSPLAAWLMFIRLADIKHFLGALLALAFGCLWDQAPYSGFGLMARVVFAHCCTRILRVACFMSTVLPSPRPGCYSRRFPPVPDTWQGILWVGLTKIRGFGGCNDLVFSGHGAFWSLAPLALQTYYPGKVSWLMWLALFHTSLRDVLDHQHYSVDMVLAPVVTAAVWTWLKWVYPEEEPLPRRQEGAQRDPPNVFVVGLIMFALFVAGFIVIVGKA